MTPATSDRAFGSTLAAALAIVAAWPILHRAPVRPWALGAALVFAAASIACPALLHPANVAWTALGVLLGKLTTPVAAAVLYYFIVTPAGLIMRMLGNDPLRLRIDRAATTYWIERQPPGPAPESMRRQF